ncbi:uncharacterized protein SCHCODRAFT_02593747 [Schizophyllum commune H4-8]|uniref:Uncharacterized protein n=1 Tax=Schizophyllum commune (strain H4-8 / FGSC 9210) TaxID=578458 RepID=D8QL39_SCHCM|nr:uncharacterized protein SCHCODRAFT_02593747 [Schizophyllum commune H4-8]KAI5885306.1 hypothetical protein SCHCODRAFT_02593747 [Schizophyllum commune H4-8]
MYICMPGIVFDSPRAQIVKTHVLRGSAPTCSFRTPIKPSESAVIPLALQGPKNAKSTSIAPRSAPVALADRRDDTQRQTGGGLGSARGGAERRCVAGAFGGGKNRKLTSNEPRSAREVLDGSRECREGAGGGAKRRRAFTSSVDAFKYSSRYLSALRSHPHRARRPGDMSKVLFNISLTVNDPKSSITTSHMLGSNRISSGEQGLCLASLAPALLVLSLRFVAPSSDEYLYRRPPSEGLTPSHPRGVLDFATLPELPVPPATPSFRVSTDFNTLGADVHYNEIAFDVTELE